MRLAIVEAKSLTLCWLVRSREGPTSTLQPGWAALCFGIVWYA